MRKQIREQSGCGPPRVEVSEGGQDEASQNPSLTHILIVLDLLQGLDLPQGLVGDAILQPPQSHLLESNDLSSL